MTTPSFNQHLTAWKQAVAGQKHPPLPLEIVATSLDEFQNWQGQLQATKIKAEWSGYTCQFNKGGTKSGRMAAWIVCNGHTLKITFTAAKQPKHTNATQTSKESYHALDLGDACKEMALFALDMMEDFGYCTDLGVERQSGKLKSNLVSARRANIEKAGGIKLDNGEIYQIEMTGKTVRDPVTGRSSNTWKILKRFIEPAADAVQTELF